MFIVIPGISLNRRLLNRGSTVYHNALNQGPNLVEKCSGCKLTAALLASLAVNVLRPNKKICVFPVT